MLNTVLVLVIVVAVALLPADISASSKYTKGILVDSFSRALNIPGNSFANGAEYKAVAKYDRTDPTFYLNTGDWQKDSVFAANSSFYIKTVFNGKCVTAQSGTLINQQDCTGAGNQRWKYYKQSDIYSALQLLNEQTGKCLGFGLGGSTTVLQIACKDAFFATDTTWQIEQFAIVTVPGHLKSVSKGKCLLNRRTTYCPNCGYQLHTCDAQQVDQLKQQLYMWDNAAINGVGQRWNSATVAKKCTAVSDSDYSKVSEVDCPTTTTTPARFQWINVGNVDYQFMIKNIAGGLCLSAVPDPGSNDLRLRTCDPNDSNLYWIRVHAQSYMKQQNEICWLGEDCLSDGCFPASAWAFPPDKFTTLRGIEGLCVNSKTGAGCRKREDCQNFKCRSGKCECLTHKETDVDNDAYVNLCTENSDCCSGNCEADGTCGCHAYWQPCETNSDCCSNSCDPTNKICNCVKTGIAPYYVFNVPAGGAFPVRPELCCSGQVVEATGACDKGDMGTYCTADSECKSGNCHELENFCACGSLSTSTCTEDKAGYAYCASCFGRGSVCHQGKCCYMDGAAVPCVANGGSDGIGSNNACCGYRCKASGTSCASGRDTSYCSSGGPSCYTPDYILLEIGRAFGGTD